MEIIKEANGQQLTVKLVGRLDTTTAPSLQNELDASLGGVSELILDFEGLEYVSSAGLRVLLAAQKVMSKQGSMVVRKVSEEIMEVFDMTGFSDILTIE